MKPERLAYLRQQVAMMPVVGRATVWCWMQELLNEIDRLRAALDADGIPEEREPVYAANHTIGTEAETKEVQREEA